MTLVARLIKQMFQSIRNDELEQEAIDTLIEQAQRIEELDAVIKVLSQTVLEVRHAQQCGPGWYTKGAKGLFMQVRLHLDRADEALKTIELNTQDT